MSSENSFAAHFSVRKTAGFGLFLCVRHRFAVAIVLPHNHGQRKWMTNYINSAIGFAIMKSWAKENVNLIVVHVLLQCLSCKRQAKGHIVRHTNSVVCVGKTAANGWQANSYQPLSEVELYFLRARPKNVVFDDAKKVSTVFIGV